MVSPEKPEIRIQKITAGPHYHWFGYYDKHQLDATGRYLLSMQVDFEHRLPKPGEPVKLGLIDLKKQCRWSEIGASYAWSWQQGCMLQWRPGSKHEIVWNDRENNRFVCRVLNIKTGELRTLPMALEHIRPDGKYAACADFSRIYDIRPGYGYPGIPDPYRQQNTPEQLGVWRMDMETGDREILVSVADLVARGSENLPRDQKHYVNHLAWSPDGKRIVMFHRWTGKGQPTRVFTVGQDGRDLRLLSAQGASHWTWRDPLHVTIWSRDDAGEGYKLYKDDGSGEPVKTIYNAPNGHQSYVPGTDKKWMITDTYPSGKNRVQTLYMIYVPTGKSVVLGRFSSPPAYEGEWRCDLHPRVDSKGRYVIFDSAHEGHGRQQYMVDISGVISAQNL